MVRQGVSLLDLSSLHCSAIFYKTALYIIFIQNFSIYCYCVYIKECYTQIASLQLHANGGNKFLKMVKNNFIFGTYCVIIVFNIRCILYIIGVYEFYIAFYYKISSLFYIFLKIAPNQICLEQNVYASRNWRTFFFSFLMKNLIILY